MFVLHYYFRQNAPYIALMLLAALNAVYVYAGVIVFGVEKLSAEIFLESFAGSLTLIIAVMTCLAGALNRVHVFSCGVLLLFSRPLGYAMIRRRLAPFIVYQQTVLGMVCVIGTVSCLLAAVSFISYCIDACLDVACCCRYLACTHPSPTTASLLPVLPPPLPPGSDVDIESCPPCLICLEPLTREDFEMGRAISLRCMCRGEMSVRHRSCALKWFLKRPRRPGKSLMVCEVCDSDVTNI
jgi:hypothetical protein